MTRSKENGKRSFYGKDMLWETTTLAIVLEDKDDYPVAGMEEYVFMVQGTLKMVMERERSGDAGKRIHTV